MQLENARGLVRSFELVHWKALGQVYSYISCSGIPRVSGSGSETGAEPANRTFVSSKEFYRHVYGQPQNGDMGSKRLSRAIFEVDWIVEHLKILLGLISPVKQGYCEEIRLARLQNQITPHEKPRSYPYRKTVNPASTSSPHCH